MKYKKQFSIIILFIITEYNTTFGSSKLTSKIPSSTNAPTPRKKSTGKNDPIAIINQKCQSYTTTLSQTQTTTSTTTKYSNFKFKVASYVTDGVSAKPNEFPHMALIGFEKSVGEVEWKCGGSLISEQFVLSAAHCSRYKKPKWIRLGEFDLSTSGDETYFQDFKIVTEFPHPLYKVPHNYHDIILYKMRQSVQFSKHVMPICLYTASKTVAPKKAMITGWGYTAADEVRSDKLIKATINILDQKLCKSIYEGTSAFSKGYNESITICAGDLEAKRDTCQGDSGGPLQISIKRAGKRIFFQVGITSTGSTDCGDGQPAVYTNVAFYLNWIQSIVWPNKKKQ